MLPLPPLCLLDHHLQPPEAMYHMLSNVSLLLLRPWTLCCVMMPCLLMYRLLLQGDLKAMTQSSRFLCLLPKVCALPLQPLCHGAAPHSQPCLSVPPLLEGLPPPFLDVSPLD